MTIKDLTARLQKFENAYNVLIYLKANENLRVEVDPLVAAMDFACKTEEEKEELLDLIEHDPGYQTKRCVVATSDKILCVCSDRYTALEAARHLKGLNPETTYDVGCQVLHVSGWRFISVEQDIQPKKDLPLALPDGFTELWYDQSTRNEYCFWTIALKNDQTKTAYIALNEKNGEYYLDERLGGSLKPFQELEPYIEALNTASV